MRRGGVFEFEWRANYSGSLRARLNLGPFWHAKTRVWPSMDRYRIYSSSFKPPHHVQACTESLPNMKCVSCKTTNSQPEVVLLGYRITLLCLETLGFFRLGLALLIPYSNCISNHQKKILMRLVGAWHLIISYWLWIMKLPGRKLGWMGLESLQLKPCPMRWRWPPLHRWAQTSPWESPASLLSQSQLELACRVSKSTQQHRPPCLIGLRKGDVSWAALGPSCT